MWSGAIVDIPAGYHLCDGDAGTPDLRDKFIVGAGTTYNPADTGGSNTQQHAFTSSQHAHNIEAGTGIGAGADYNENVSLEAVSGTTDAADNRPPYYSLAYIQRIA